ncbi:MAG: YajQ family cyclic di-GMP-binding protein [Acidobacteria bacterium]|nr:YajQ family cyclic di-GMP-binding protein [Acidobacteriota bacterium]
MAADSSFDVVSKVELQEVKNAIDQASKEVASRFDLKNSKSTIALEGEDTIALASQDEYTIKAITDILNQKLIKRGISLKNLDYQKIEPAAGQSVRQKIKLVQGIPGDKAKKIVAAIKDAKVKAQASINGDTVRVSSKDRDTLQEVIALLRKQDFGVELQFTNYR